jgi:integrase/recombinase XerD
MARAKFGAAHGRVRGHTEKPNSLRESARQTVRLWRKHHLTYDQTKHVVEHVRRELQIEAPKQRRRTLERLDRAEVERLIEAAYSRSSRYGFMIKMLFYTGARVSEFVQFRVEDLHLMLERPQVYIAYAKGEWICLRE